MLTDILAKIESEAREAMRQHREIEAGFCWNHGNVAEDWPCTVVTLARRELALVAALREAEVALGTILLGCPPDAQDTSTEHGADHLLACAALAQVERILSEEPKS